MKGKCTCNIWTFLLGLALLAAGFYGLVAGFAAHMGGTVYYEVLAWYFGGFLFLTLGKWLKYSGCGTCKVHGKK